MKKVLIASFILTANCSFAYCDFNDQSCVNQEKMIDLQERQLQQAEDAEINRSNDAIIANSSR